MLGGDALLAGLEEVTKPAAPQPGTVNFAAALPCLDDPGAGGVLPSSI